METSRFRTRSRWHNLPEYVAHDVMIRLRWARTSSAIVRSVCKGWRDVHDQLVRSLALTKLPNYNACSDTRRHPFWERFQGVTNLILCGTDVSVSGVEISLIAASLSRLSSINLSCCDKLSDDGVKALAGLTALTSLNLSRCTSLTCFSNARTRILDVLSVVPVQVFEKEA